MGVFYDAGQASLTARTAALAADPVGGLAECVRRATKMTNAVRFTPFLSVAAGSAQFRRKQATVRVDPASTGKLLGQWKLWFVLGDPAVAFLGPYTTVKIGSSEPWPLVAVDMATAATATPQSPTTVMRPCIELADIADLIDPTS